MVPLTSLLIPIVASAVLVFLASSFIHMVLPYHRSDYTRVPDEDGFLNYIRGLNLQPGDYHAPLPPGGQSGMKDPAFVELVSRGPIVTMSVQPGWTGMGKPLGLWFVYTLVVVFFGAYLGSRFLQPGAEYLDVFRLIGTSVFMGFGLALAQYAIWYGRQWSSVLKSMFDALIYALLTAGVFGWLWPA